MDIEHRVYKNGEEVPGYTEKSENLSDSESEIYEKIEEIQEVFKKYNTPFILIFPNQNKLTGRIHNYITPQNCGMAETMCLLKSLGYSLNVLSQNNVQISFSPFIMEEFAKMSELTKKFLEDKGLPQD